MVHKAIAMRDEKVEHINTSFILKSTHIRNMFKAFTKLEFPLTFVLESNNMCISRGQKTENSQTFLSC